MHIAPKPRDPWSARPLPALWPCGLWVASALRLTRWLLVLLPVFAASLVPARADQSNQANAVPSFAELQDAGAVVGEIRINNQDIFDLDDPKENNALFRLANKLHIRTRPGVLRRMLLFKSGEPLSVRLIEETERLLRSNGYLYDVSIRPVAYHDGVVDIDVTTRDTWSLYPGLSFGRAGGANSGSIGLEENNLLGTGVSLGVSRSSDVDRTAPNSDVRRIMPSMAGRPSATVRLTRRRRAPVFQTRQALYALDARWAAGVTLSQDNRIDSVTTAV